MDLFDVPYGCCSPAPALPPGSWPPLLRPSRKRGTIRSPHLEKNTPPPPPPLSVPAIVTVREAASGGIIRNVRGNFLYCCCRKYVSGPWNRTGSARRRARRVFLTDIPECAEGPRFLRRSRVVDRCPPRCYQIERPQERSAFQDVSCERKNGKKSYNGGGIQQQPSLGTKVFPVIIIELDISFFGSFFVARDMAGEFLTSQRSVINLVQATQVTWNVTADLILRRRLAVALFA